MFTRKSLWTFLRLAVIAGCFWIILRRVSLPDVFAKLAAASLPRVGIALVLLLAEPVVMAWKWSLLLRQKEINIGVWRLARTIFTSNFFGVAIPVSAGADAIRVLMLKAQKHSLTHSASSLIVDHILGAVSLIIMSLVATAFVWRGLPQARDALWGVIAVSGVVVVLVAVAASRLPAVLIGRIRSRLVPGLPERLARGVGDVHESFRSFIRTPRTLLVVLALNFLIQFLRIAEIHFLFRAVHGPVPVSHELAFVPIIILLSLLPISFFGLGVKEASFLFFFTQTGVPAESCLGVSFLTYVLTFLGMLPGAVFALVASLGAGGDRPSSAAGETGEDAHE